MTRIVIAILLISLSMSFNAQAQTLQGAEEITYNYKLESALKNLDFWRFGLISVYKLEDTKTVQDMVASILGGEEEEAGEKPTDEEIAKFVDEYGQDVLNLIEEKTQAGDDAEAMQELIFNNYTINAPLATIKRMMLLYNIIDNTQKIRSAYVITTRATSKDNKGEIIALIVSKLDAGVVWDINGADNKYIFTNIEMKKVEGENQKTLYSLVNDYLNQDFVVPVTSDIQGIGLIDMYVQKGAGSTKSLVKDESNITPEDTEMFIRISEGAPLNMKLGKLNQLIISPDLISWKKYPWDEEEDDIDETVVNERLPMYGVELRYGVDELNFPSFWSERWTLNAMWHSAKLGLVLPTNGWSSVFNDDILSLASRRKFTTAGVGISAQFDFPFPVIKRSGVFRVNMSYVSGDADESPFKMDKDINDLTMDRNFDHLIRAHGQLHYTFGVNVDNNHLFRFGIGGTVYNVEKWHYEVEEGSEGLPNTKKFKYYNDETYGGISGRIDFMTNFRYTTPWGVSLQYFDETIGLNGWILFPIIENTLAMKLAANSFISLRDDDMELYPWEYDNKAVIIPMLRFIYTF